MQLDNYLSIHPTVSSSSSSSSMNNVITIPPVESSAVVFLTQQYSSTDDHTVDSKQDQTPTGTINPIPLTIHTLPWYIRTKYYTANVEWYILPSSEFLRPTELTLQLFNPNNDTDNAQQQQHPIEALILLIDPTQQKTPFLPTTTTHLPSTTTTTTTDSLSTSHPSSSSSVSSLTEILSSWITVINSNNNPPPCLLLLSNKVDIITQKIPGDIKDDYNNHHLTDNTKPSLSYGSMDSSFPPYRNNLTTLDSEEPKENNNGTDSIDSVTVSESVETTPFSLSANSTSSSSSTDPVLIKKYREYTNFIQDWCLDNGFEHIEIVATSPLVGAHTRDKVNIPRVLEALQSNMWSNMERTKPSTTSFFQQSSSASSSTTVQLTTTASLSSSFTENTVEENNEALSTTDTKPSKPQNFFQAMRNAVEAGERGDNVDDENDNSEDNEVDDDEDIDIGALMEEMQRVRNQAQTGNLSDEARREAASRMIMKLYSVLGGGDDDENEQ